jgi:hypothetical protein
LFILDQARIQGISVSTQGTSSTIQHGSGVIQWTLKPTMVQMKLLKKQNPQASSSDLGNTLQQVLNLLSSPPSMDIPLNSQSLVTPVTFTGVSMETTYVDDEIRICRDDQNHFYVWSRA